MSPSPDLGRVVLPDDVLDSLRRAPLAVGALSTRDAEIADLLATAGLEPALEPARPALHLAAANRGGRTRLEATT